MSRSGALSALRRRLLGVAFLTAIVVFLAGTIAIYQRAFVPTVRVQLHTASAGSQLQPESDVKVHGMIVGRVETIEATQRGATLNLALEPDKAKQLPANISARLLPRTLFGERYVSLEMPDDASTEPLASGDVIKQDRSKAAVELETVLADTMPVLQAVRPDELAVTLNALSQALEGRGESLGETITQLNTYLDGFNPSIPDLRDNLRELVGVAETYSEAAPDVVRALSDLTTTSRTLVQQRANLDALTTQLTTTANDTRTFLADNRQNLIQLGDTARPTLDVLAKYAPAYPCFLGTMVELKNRADVALGKGTNEPGLHITLEVTAHRGKYEPNQDEPEYADKRGPRCYAGMPQPFPQYPPDGGPIQDGSEPPPAAIPENPYYWGTQPSGNTPASTSPQSAELGYLNSPAERDLVSTVLAPSLGKPASEVPGWGSLLVGPVLRGAEVSYR